MVGRGAWGSPMRFVARMKRPSRAYRGQPLKVLMFNESLTAGGCERNLVELATNFDQGIVDPQVLIYHQDLHYAHRLEEGGVPWTLIEKTQKVDLRFMQNLASWLRREKPDVIHSFLPTPNFWMKLARLPGGAPPLVVFLGSIQPSTKDFLLDRALRGLISQVIVNSTTARDEAINRFGFSPARVHLIYNGVDLDHFHPGPRDVSIREGLQVPDSARLLTVVARVRGEKNHACLVRSLCQLQGQGALPGDFYARFVGRLADTDLVASLEAELKQAGLFERVRFVGPRSDIADILRASDLLVLPSLYEGCPNAVQEAMASGLGIIASDVSDNAKLVHHGKNGYLFPVDDHHALSEQLCSWLALSVNERLQMGTISRELSKSYSMDSYVRQTVSVYFHAMETG